MFKQPLKLCSAKSLNNLSGFLRHNARSESTQTATKHKWDLLSAVCLERHPVVTKPMNDLEAKFQDMLNQIELENSMKSDHELRHEMDKAKKELQKQGTIEDADLDLTLDQTAQDLEDAGDKELAEFKFSPRITEADEKNIKTSLERKLDRCLLLLVEQKVGKENFWLPPQGNRAEGETMRQAAERVLKEICGDELNARIYGNAPMGFYKYVYPKTVREQEGASHGAKVFYYLAKHLKGNVGDKVKHQWLDREELEKVMPKPIHKSVSMFLVTD